MVVFKYVDSVEWLNQGDYQYPLSLRIAACGGNTS